MKPPLEPDPCPDPITVDDVLDGLVTPEHEAGVRRHVRSCADCLQRFGPSFELELWAAAAVSPRLGKDQGTAADVRPPGAPVLASSSTTTMAGFHPDVDAGDPGTSRLRTVVMRPRTALALVAAAAIVVALLKPFAEAPAGAGAADLSSSKAPARPKAGESCSPTPPPAFAPGIQYLRVETEVERRDETRREVLTHHSSRPQLVSIVEEIHRDGDRVRLARTVPLQSLR